MSAKVSTRSSGWVRRWWVTGVAASVLAALCLWGLTALPYSTSDLRRLSDEETQLPPDATSFTLEGVTWDLAQLEASAVLEPLRRDMASTCASRSGLDAALCLSDSMASHFAHGSPTSEPFDANYAPALSLEAHRAGAVGHCVTRSSLIAAMLLSTGTPARLLQLIRPDGLGHNILEVWDGEGWVAFDPSFGLVFEVRGNAGVTLASSTSLARSTAFEVRRLGASPAGEEGIPAFYSGGLAFAGARIYPEPWLYVRTGQRHATWPLRGAFLVAGEQSWLLGPLQSLLRAAIVTLSVMALASFAITLRSRPYGRGKGTVRATTRSPAGPVRTGPGDHGKSPVHAVDPRRLRDATPTRSTSV